MYFLWSTVLAGICCTKIDTTFMVQGQQERAELTWVGLLPFQILYKTVGRAFQKGTVERQRSLIYNEPFKSTIKYLK